MVETLSVFEVHGLRHRLSKTRLAGSRVGVGAQQRIGLAALAVRGGPMVARTMGAGG